mmetsp:Transcript_19884/g.64004  ORF Transcript_19884/g.64004 Transcript_19884/m.64004 type:complete len:328 (-) Transcript_19884:33-1016(-)
MTCPHARPPARDQRPPATQTQSFEAQEVGEEVSSEVLYALLREGGADGVGFDEDGGLVWVSQKGELEILGGLRSELWCVGEFEVDLDGFLLGLVGKVSNVKLSLVFQSLEGDGDVDVHDTLRLAADHADGGIALGLGVDEGHELRRTVVEVEVFGNPFGHVALLPRARGVPGAPELALLLRLWLLRELRRPATLARGQLRLAVLVPGNRLVVVLVLARVVLRNPGRRRLLLRLRLLLRRRRRRRSLRRLLDLRRRADALVVLVVLALAVQGTVGHLFTAAPQQLHLRLAAVLAPILLLLRLIVRVHDLVELAVVHRHRRCGKERGRR